MKKPDQQVTASQHGLGTWEGGLSSKEDQRWPPRKRGISPLMFNMDILLVSAPSSLIITADGQCMFERPQTGCSSPHQMQVSSCISQNDFPRPQYVNIPFTTPKRLQETSTADCRRAGLANGRGDLADDPRAVTSSPAGTLGGRALLLLALFCGCGQVFFLFFIGIPLIKKYGSSHTIEVSGGKEAAVIPDCSS